LQSFDITPPKSFLSIIIIIIHVFTCMCVCVSRQVGLFVL